MVLVDAFRLLVSILNPRGHHDDLHDDLRQLYVVYDEVPETLDMVLPSDFFAKFLKFPWAVFAAETKLGCCILDLPTRSSLILTIAFHLDAFRWDHLTMLGGNVAWRFVGSSLTSEVMVESSCFSWC